ncbi:hypothetical protein Hanom_Chr10g00914751 [Helianthus anomalus]
MMLMCDVCVICVFNCVCSNICDLVPLPLAYQTFSSIHQTLWDPKPRKLLRFGSWFPISSIKGFSVLGRFQPFVQP